MRPAAILCASGIGDGLLMMIGAHHLKCAGFVPTIYHDKAHILSPLFEKALFLPHAALEELEETLKKYDHVLIENDNSARAWRLFELRKKETKTFTFFFPYFSGKSRKWRPP